MRHLKANNIDPSRDIPCAAALRLSASSLPTSLTGWLTNTIYSRHLWIFGKGVINKYSVRQAAVAVSAG